MKTTRTLALALALALTARESSAQDSRDRIATLTKVPENVLSSMAYWFNRPDEQLWCVTRWHVDSLPDAIVYTIDDVKRVEHPQTSASRIANISAECRDANGDALPTIHSHPEGECQASPHDLEAVVTRRAAFDGILCGPRAMTFSYASVLIDAWSWRQQVARVTP